MLIKKLNLFSIYFHIQSLYIFFNHVHHSQQTFLSYRIIIGHNWFKLF
jgi:hypothetical protein